MIAPRRAEIHPTFEHFGRRYYTFSPPKGDFCLINDLPVELLLRIFQLGIDEGLSEDIRDLMIARHRVAGCTGPYQYEPGHTNADDVTVDGSRNREFEGWTGDMNMPEQTGSGTGLHLTHPFQIVISHVCQHWRNISISTSSLWTTILISQASRPLYQRVAVFLERSKCSPLDICVYFEPRKPEQPKFDANASMEDLGSLYSLLVAHIRRWRSIEVRSMSAHQMYAFLHAASQSTINDAPQLTSILLSASQPTGADGVFWYRIQAKQFSLFNGSAPWLKSISLERIPIDWSQNLIAYASRLTKLELRRHSEDVTPSWHEFATILRNAHALESLVLQEFELRGDPNLEMVKLPKLSHLSLSFLSRLCVFGFFRVVHIPALKSLIMDLSWTTYTTFLDQITAPAALPTLSSVKDRPRALLRSLETLYINCHFCPKEVIEALYDELENVRSLKISMSINLYPPSGCALILPLLPSPVSSHNSINLRLPRLETLTICNVSGHRHVQVIRGVMQRRHEVEFPIRELYLMGRCDVDKEDLAWFEEHLETFAFS